MREISFAFRPEYKFKIVNGRYVKVNIRLHYFECTFSQLRPKNSVSGNRPLVSEPADPRICLRKCR